MDCPLFQNVSIWDTRHNYYHYIVLGFLRSADHQDNHRYLGNLQRSYLSPPSKQIRKDRCFADFHWDIPKPPPRERRGNKWISVETCCLVSTRVVLQQEPQRYQHLICKLVRKLQVILKLDRQCRAETAGTEVKSLLVPYPPLEKDTLIRIWGWYCAVEYIPSPAKGFH